MVGCSDGYVFVSTPSKSFGIEHIIEFLVDDIETRGFYLDGPVSAVQLFSEGIITPRTTDF